MCSERKKRDMSEEQDSTAAVKVWRRQTAATVGSPVEERRHWTQGMDHEALTSEDMFVYARQLDVRIGGVGDDQAVDDALSDGLGHGMSEEALDLDASSTGCVRSGLRGIIVENVRERSIAKFVEVCGRCADNVCGPAINLPLQPRRRILIHAARSERLQSALSTYGGMDAL